MSGPKARPQTQSQSPPIHNQVRNIQNTPPAGLQQFRSAADEYYPLQHQQPGFPILMYPSPAGVSATHIQTELMNKQAQMHPMAAAHQYHGHYTAIQQPARAPTQSLQQFTSLYYPQRQRHVAMPQAAPQNQQSFLIPSQHQIIIQNSQPTNLMMGGASPANNYVTSQFQPPQRVPAQQYVMPSTHQQGYVSQGQYYSTPGNTGLYNYQQQPQNTAMMMQQHQGTQQPTHQHPQPKRSCAIPIIDPETKRNVLEDEMKGVDSPSHSADSSARMTPSSTALTMQTDIQAQFATQVAATLDTPKKKKVPTATLR